MTVEQTDRSSRPETWRLPEGLQLLGPVQGSGLRDPSYLVRRDDGQVVQVSELLQLVISAVDPDRPVDQICATVSDACGRTLTPEGFAYLVESRLAPLGLVEKADDEPHAPAPSADPLLSLSLRGTLIPPGGVRRLARVLAPLYWPPVVTAALVGLAVLDISLLRQGDLLAALDQMLATPMLLLALFVLFTAAALIHEVGHAAACRYGGGEPGRIGFGVYLVFPAFYTDVTDSYRLPRAARIRTDLGGLYFNVWCLLLGGGLYLTTGEGIFLLMVLLLHLEMLQQLLPIVRLDGYYVLADVAGVPNLFARVRPVLRSLVPGRPADPRVAELRPAARRVVVGWVLVVVPLLVLGFGWLLWQLPVIVERSAGAIQAHAADLALAWSAADWAAFSVSLISVLLLMVPLVGIAMLLWKTATLLVRAFRRRSTRPAPTEEEKNMTLEVQRFSTENDPRQNGGIRETVDVRSPEMTAAAFTDLQMLPAQPVAPKQGWRRVVYRASGHAINPGKGPAELRQEVLQQRLRTPIRGSRRVVVMSRKGGVGKTTTSLALGSIFSSMRGDRVIAVDANPDAGNLAHRVAPVSRWTITDVLADMEHITRYAELRSYTTQSLESRLEVLASDNDPRIGMALARDDYHRLISLLDRFYNLIILDTGTGILDSANQGLINEADDLVLVLRPGLDGGRAAALTLDWLEEHGFGELVSRAVVVINSVHRGVGAPIEPMSRHFEQRCGRVVTVPWDPALETGAQTQLSSLREETRDSLVEMAAAVADNFDLAGMRL